MVSKRKLPARRQQILNFIQEFIGENGIPPTVRDIQRACDVSSTSVVDYNLHKLRQARYLNRRPDVARGIELLDENEQPVSSVPKVQIVGAIAAGMPIPVFPLRAWLRAKSSIPSKFRPICRGGTVGFMVSR